MLRKLQFSYILDLPLRCYIYPLGGPGPPQSIGGPLGPPNIQKILIFNEKIPFNIQKIAKNRTIQQIITKKFKNAQKVNFSGHWQGGSLKDFFKNSFGGPRAPKMNIWGPRAPKNAKNRKNVYFYIE